MDSKSLIRRCVQCDVAVLAGDAPVILVGDHLWYLHPGLCCARWMLANPDRRDGVSEEFLIDYIERFSS